jgi:hypothetical protein
MINKKAPQQVGQHLFNEMNQPLTSPLVAFCVPASGCITGPLPFPVPEFSPG